MKPIVRILALIFSSVFFYSCNSSSTVELFNGKNLDNWEIYVSSDEVLPDELFWVESGVIHTAGKPHGYIRSRETYKNFKLHVEWRWTEQPTNSGVLIHVQGEDMIWPLAIECQLMHEHAGDIVLIGKGSGIQVGDSTYQITSEENRYAIIDKFEDSSENPPGEWNSYEITSLDGTLGVSVNGVLQNKGTDMTLAEGNILLQSEGSPMEFRNISLVVLDE